MQVLSSRLVVTHAVSLGKCKTRFLLHEHWIYLNVLKYVMNVFSSKYFKTLPVMFSKRSREHIYSSAPSLFPLCWSCSWVTERWRWPKDWVSILKKMLPSTTCIWPKPFLSFKFNFCQNKWAVKSQEDTCKCSRSPIGNSVGQFCDLLVPKWRYINWWIKPQIKAPAFF